MAFSLLPVSLEVPLVVEAWGLEEPCTEVALQVDRLEDLQEDLKVDHHEVHLMEDDLMANPSQEVASHRMDEEANHVQVREVEARNLVPEAWIISFDMGEGNCQAIAVEVTNWFGWFVD